MRSTISFSLRVPLKPCRSFSTSKQFQTNRLFDPVRTPPAFYDYLRSCSANKTLLLAIFTTSACTPCRTITPILKSIVESREADPKDEYSGIAFTEVELDSPDTTNGATMELGMQYGVTSLPTLIGFGGRRADRVTDRITDTKMMNDRDRMEKWIGEQMQNGDQHPSSGPVGKGVFDKFFG